MLPVGGLSGRKSEPVARPDTKGGGEAATLLPSKRILRRASIRHIALMPPSGVHFPEPATRPRTVGRALRYVQNMVLRERPGSRSSVPRSKFHRLPCGLHPVCAAMKEVALDQSAEPNLTPTR